MLYSRLLLSASLLIGSTAAFAQIHRMERPDTLAHAYNLNPVVVTGSGHHQRLKSTATPVRVLSAQEMKEQGITTFDAALTRMMPQVSMAPNSMGSQLRLNALGNKYILILINGQKLSGDIANNVDLNRINMLRVKRIEVLDGAASSLYGSDAIAGVINIITDQPTAPDGFPVGITSDTRLSGHGVLTENVALDIYKNGFGSYTSFAHDRANSYRNNDLVYKTGSDTETQPSIAPLFTGYRASLVGQKFTYSPSNHLALNAGLDYSYKITDRPNTATVPDGAAARSTAPTGGTDYEMRYKGLRWNVGGIYKFNAKNSLQADFTTDRFRYGKEYDVQTKTNAIGDYVQSKKQRTMEGSVKAILNFSGRSFQALRQTTGMQSLEASPTTAAQSLEASPTTAAQSLEASPTTGTTIIGADWRRDCLTATSGNIDQSAYILAAYAQHEQRVTVGRGFASATVGLRYNYHGDFGSHLTPKATLMYSLGPVNLRATYSAGFRAPGLDELHYRYFSVNRGKAQVSFGNHDLKPEKSHYVALNAEWRIVGNASKRYRPELVVSVTGFLNRVNDMVVKQNIDVDDATRRMLMGEFPEMTQDQADKMVSYALYQNSDKGDIKGIQANLSANLLPGFSLSANYAYAYARSLTVPAGDADGGEWQPLDRSIRHTATIAANWHHAFGKVYALNVNLNGRLQSSTYYADPYENAPGFGIWNLYTTHTFTLRSSGGKVRSVEPGIGIDNLFDRADRRIDSSTRKYALYSPGRMLVAGLKVNL